MSYFKKFTDFCAGIAAFAVALFFIRKYMAFTPTAEELEKKSKLKVFIEVNTDYSMLATLAALLVISVIVGAVFRRLPYVCFAASMLPLLTAVCSFGKDLLHVLGNLVDGIFRDREDGRHRLWIATRIASLGGAALCLWVTKLRDKAPAELPKDIELWKEDIFSATSLDIEIMTTLGWMLHGDFVIGTLLYNVYFIDAIISAVPLVYSIHAYYSGNLSVFPLVFMAVAATCFIGNLLLTVFENNLSYKEQKLLREAGETKNE